MSIDVAYSHIEKPEGQPARLKRVPRVRVSQIVLDYLAHGWSVDEMCRQHSYLEPAEAHAAMAYYYDHRDEIEAEIEAEWNEAQRSRVEAGSSPFLTRLRAKGLR